MGEDLATSLSYWLGTPPPILYLLVLKECTNNMSILSKRYELPAWLNLNSCTPVVPDPERGKWQSKLLLKHLTRCDEHPTIFHWQADDSLAVRSSLPVNTITCHPHPFAPHISLCLSLCHSFYLYLFITSCSFFIQYTHIARPPRCPAGHAVQGVSGFPSCWASRWQKVEETWHSVSDMVWGRQGWVSGWAAGWGGCCVWTCLAWAPAVCLSVVQWVIHCKTERTHIQASCVTQLK